MGFVIKSTGPFSRAFTNLFLLKGLDMTITGGTDFLPRS
jgi:hypothetical protein